MAHPSTQSTRIIPRAIATVAALLPIFCASRGLAQQAAPAPALGADQAAAINQRFQQHIQPLLNKYCLRCHNADKMKSGIRVDNLDGMLAGRTPFLWKDIREQLADEAMPPDDEPQPTAEERQSLTQWIDDAIVMVRSRKQAKNGSVRRLTVSQYRNALGHLLGLDDDLTEVLPPEAISKEGFANNAQTMLL